MKTVISDKESQSHFTSFRSGYLCGGVGSRPAGVRPANQLQIGALFPLHRQIAGSESCGQIWEQYGIQRTEIALQTVREMNQELPFRLGISVR